MQEAYTHGNHKARRLFHPLRLEKQHPPQFKLDERSGFDILPTMESKTNGIQIFNSFKAADDSERQERWNMSPDERLEILERLRSLKYPDEKAAPRLLRVLEIASKA